MMGMVASYFNSWFPGASSTTAASSSGAMCGTDIVNDLIYQAVGVRCDDKDSLQECNSDPRCQWVSEMTSYYGYGCDFTYGYPMCYYGYHSGVMDSCRVFNNTQCRDLGRGDCQGRSDCVWDEASLWCFSGNVTVQDLYQGCVGSGTMATCTMMPLEAWSGTLASGMSVFDTRRMSGSLFRPLSGSAVCSSVGTVPLLHVGCDQRVDILPGTAAAVSAYLPSLPVSSVLDAILSFAADCSMTSLGLSPLTANQLSANFRYALVHLTLTVGSGTRRFG